MTAPNGGRSRGVIAAGHPTTAAAGADVLRAGGNAIDAAVAAVLTSMIAEPMLTGLGAGGYMLVAPPSGAAVLLDFFVEVPGHGADPRARAELVPVEVSFDDAVQMFNVGPASCGVYGLPAGVWEATRRFGSMALADLAAPAARLAREGVALNAQQAYVVRILGAIGMLTPEVRSLYAPAGRLLREGDVIRNPELADALERLARDGPEPFYSGELARAVVDWLGERGGSITAEDLAGYRVIDRKPVSVRYRGREVLTNPPPSAGGALICYALALLDRDPGPPHSERLAEVMELAQAERTAAFLAGLDEPGFLERFAASRLGSTTHVSVLDANGWACAVTCSNGEGSGIVVPGTGLHINNMMGESDLNPLGFHAFAPGRRMPSMMAPTVVRRDGAAELVLGSAGSNRIRSAILQTIVNVVDHELPVDQAVEAPRLHVEDGVVYAEPGVETASLQHTGRGIARFRTRNLFFGGVQAVGRSWRTGELLGGGDPRRGGAALVA